MIYAHFRSFRFRNSSERSIVWTRPEASRPKQISSDRKMFSSSSPSERPTDGSVASTRSLRAPQIAEQEAHMLCPESGFFPWKSTIFFESSLSSLVDSVRLQSQCGSPSGWLCNDGNSCWTVLIPLSSQNLTLLPADYAGILSKLARVFRSSAA